MKKIQTNFFKGYKVIISGVLAILGFACTKENAAPEYGTPSAKFIVNGKVTAVDTNTPIKNIRVTMKGDTAFTDDQGNFQVMNNWDFPTDQIYPVKFQDVDNSQNGSFNEVDTVVKFINPQFTNGDGHWYQGETSQELNIKLNTKE